MPPTFNNTVTRLVPGISTVRLVWKFNLHHFLIKIEQTEPDAGRGFAAPSRSGETMSDADLILQAKADLVELASVNAALRDLLAETLPPRLAPVSAGRVVLDQAHDV